MNAIHRHLLALALLATATLATAPARAEGPDGPVVWVHLLVEAEVEGFSVRLGDVARVESLDVALQSRLRRLEVGRFDHGRLRLALSRESIGALLKDAGVAGPGVEVLGAERVTVSPKTVTVSGERLIEIARRHVDAALRGIDGVGSIRPVGTPPPLILPAPRFHLDLSVVPATRDARWAGRVELLVEARIDGHLAARVEVPMLVERHGQVVVVVRRVPRGRQIELADVELQEADLTRLGNDVCEHLDEVVGSIARTALAKGQPLRKAYVSAQPVIRRGDVVTARVRIGALEAKVLCRALEDGAPGDRIQLENVESMKTVYAVVADSRTVDASVRR